MSKATIPSLEFGYLVGVQTILFEWVRDWEEKGDWNHHVAGTDECTEPSLGAHGDIP